MIGNLFQYVNKAGGSNSRQITQRTQWILELKFPWELGGQQTWVEIGPLDQRLLGG